MKLLALLLLALPLAAQNVYVWLYDPTAPLLPLRQVALPDGWSVDKSKPTWRLVAPAQQAATYGISRTETTYTTVTALGGASEVPGPANCLVLEVWRANGDLISGWTTNPGWVIVMPQNAAIPAGETLRFVCWRIASSGGSQAAVLR